MSKIDKKIFDELVEHGLSTREIAAHFNVSIRSVQKRLAKAKEPEKEEETKVSLPEFPEYDIEPEKLIDSMVERFNKRKEAIDANTWFPVNVSNDNPIGICWFGDPHLDDDGCDWGVLRRDIDIVKNTPGLYGANIGDTTNNWAGRLIRLYADQETSLKTAQRLASWFMLDSGVPWIIWLAGNHDQMHGYAVLREMAKRYKTHSLTLHDWECRFVLKFPSHDFKVFAAHDFKGNSIYNNMHGPLRESLMGEDADLYVCGHKHNSAKYEWENPARGHWQYLLRVRGYKFIDDHARRWGYKEQQSGHSGISIFDPRDGSISVFHNIEKGAAYLRMLRDDK